MTKRSWVQTPTMETSYMVQNVLYVSLSADCDQSPKKNYIYENHEDDQTKNKW
jgi:hypothetical protein